MFAFDDLMDPQVVFFLSLIEYRKRLCSHNCTHTHPDCLFKVMERCIHNVTCLLVRDRIISISLFPSVHRYIKRKYRQVYFLLCLTLIKGAKGGMNLSALICFLQHCKKITLICRSLVSLST
jgi:hypothetical protein